ncbi:alpha/beta hydrolase [Sphingomonas sp. PAMC 26617]|uniref:alpha/beta hydrolase n=1 Tax=Sphingomonas sp. PAMC 26617 TaxID=1112216 RepID=UPI00028805C8|nr:alpha/beta hydrolase [Sphingomonas sp. PAMC 26617]
MQTAIGRVALNVLLRVAEIYPLIRAGQTSASRSLKTIAALDRSVKLRIFRPDQECRGVVLDCHGGGWTIGNARMADDQNAELAARIGVAVVSIDYRRALSNPISALVDDCEAAALWTIEHALEEFGTDRIIVKGSSAGAHLAAAMLLRLRDRGMEIKRVAGVMLFFGLYDFSGTPMVRAAGPETLILHGPTVRATLCKLTPDMTEDERRAPSVSPLYADLSGLPPALFVVGTKDMLFEDSERMASRWLDASGNAELLIAPESPHAFNRMGTSVARKVARYVEDWILERLGDNEAGS